MHRPQIGFSALLAILGVLALSCGLFFGYQSGGLTGMQSRENDPADFASTSNADHTQVAELDDDWASRGPDGKPLPKGITNPEGEGGRGIHRMVLKHGVWYPVYDPGDEALAALKSLDADPDYIPPGTPLNKVPLSIASASPPKGKAGEAYHFSFAAVGGAAPYQWNMSLSDGAEFFTLDPASGVLSGQMDHALKAELHLSLSDAASQTVSVVYAFNIVPEEALVITTTHMEPVAIGKPHAVQFMAAGGLPAYRWSMTSDDLPAEWMLDPSTGIFSGTPATAGEFVVALTVTDDQESTASQNIAVKVSSGLDITTTSPLLPAAPGGSYAKVFDATGGIAPYTWSLVEGSVPATMRVSTDGRLTGTAPTNDAMHRFTLEVADSSGLTFRKTFELAIRNALLAIPSQQKVGLAWSQTALAQAGFNAVTITRSSAPDESGAVIYQGAGSNTVDHGVPAGTTVFYTLWGMQGAEPIAYARAQVTLLPMVKNARATPGKTADPFADAVVSFSPLTPGGWGAEFVPSNVTGPPWITNVAGTPQTYSPASAATDVLSLHARDAAVGAPAGGAIVLEFKDNIIENGPGTDFSVFENVFFIRGNSNNRFMEPAIVSVALFEGQWFRFPVDVVPVTGSSIPDTSNPTYYASGFAGRNATTGDDPTDPTRSGGDAFDLQTLGIPDLTWIRFIKIEATGHNARVDDNGGQPIKHTATTEALSGQRSSGFDLDAISAVNF